MSNTSDIKEIDEKIRFFMNELFEMTEEKKEELENLLKNMPILNKKQYLFKLWTAYQKKQLLDKKLIKGIRKISNELFEYNDRKSADNLLLTL